MRQRNIKNKEEILSNSKLIIDNPFNCCGKWSEVFLNNNPICVEIGCGKCGFIMKMAHDNPNINYIGIEKNKSVLALALKDNECNYDNLRLVSIDALLIDKVFDHEIDKLYLNFSDPWPKKRHFKRRLTSEIFLELYEKIFRNNKCIEMKTDNLGLFEYSIMMFNNYGYKIENIAYDLYNSDIKNSAVTEYETKFVNKGNPIHMIILRK